MEEKTVIDSIVDFWKETNNPLIRILLSILLFFLAIMLGEKKEQREGDRGVITPDTETFSEN